MELISSNPNEESLQNGHVEDPDERRQVSALQAPSCKAERGDISRERVEEMKRDLLFLRSLLVRQERTYREDLKQQENIVADLKRSLQKRQQQHKSKSDELDKMKIENNTSQLVMKEYEQLIDYVTTWKEEAQNSFQQHKEHLLGAIQEVKEHLENTQKAYADLEMKDRRAGGVLQAERDAVGVLRAQILRMGRRMEELRCRFADRKREAEDVCSSANEELAIMTRNHQLEMSKLTALTKKAELKISSLQETLAQKTEENQTFVAMCDELINNQAKYDSSTVDSSHMAT